MKKSFLRGLCLIISLLILSTAKAENSNIFSINNLDILNTSNTLNNQLYEGIGLQEYGLTRDALDYAVKGYEKLLAEGLVSNSRYLTVIDFSQPLISRRFYLIDVETKELVVNTFVMHGKNTGGLMAEKFSNKMNSNQSSLGFYVTKNPYYGSRGYSLRLEGLETNFNSNAEARGVVLHGSQFINEERAQMNRVERSLGCPAIPSDENPEVINMLKEGSVIFIYHPSSEYLENSQLLNEI